jgi:hypothetical protein
MQGIQLVPEKVRLINTLCQNTDTHIIISSIWRFAHTVGELEVAFYLAGLRLKTIIGATTKKEVPTRGAEIKQWLDEFGELLHVDKYAIVDDIDDMLDSQRPFFVRTEGAIGIMPRDIVKLQALLQ